RDFHVTGVQTCALPIYLCDLVRCEVGPTSWVEDDFPVTGSRGRPLGCGVGWRRVGVAPHESVAIDDTAGVNGFRSGAGELGEPRAEERRVGKESVGRCV